jgi:preprotein translocase subunit SecY
MAFEETYLAFLQRLPGVTEPGQTPNFKTRLKWTALVVIAYLVMTQITVFGVAQTGYEQFRFLTILLGSEFGSLMSLGIGPIVTAAIILQLLVGSKIIPWDMQTEKGKMLFQGTQKFLGILLAFIEAVIYVGMGAIPPSSPQFFWIVVLQIALGGVLVVFMDELVSKWGFGSGIGLFIVANVSKSMMIRMFNPLTQTGTLPGPGTVPSGAIPFALTAIAGGEPLQAFLALLPVIATGLVFVLVIYAQAIRVEVPLAFGSVRGFGRRWPLKFFYTSNIPVILAAALLANVQLMARSLYSSGVTWLGTFDSNGNASGGLVYLLTPPRIDSVAGLMIFIGLFILIGVLIAHFTRKDNLRFGIVGAFLGALAWYAFAFSMGLSSLITITAMDVIRILSYSGFMIIGAMIFAMFWVTTSGMDAGSVANQIQSTGMQIPGYRRDIRVIERVLKKYISPLTVLGGASVGFLAAYADFTGALGTGTGILLATTIIYQLYEQIAQQHMEDMHPAIKRLLGK